jgi:broad specificity phosphatase PhoE
MITITYFVHGTTVDNEQHISTGWAHGELSQLGIEQAKELGSQTKNMHFDIVFCSDLKRAIHSADLAFSRHYPITQDWRLREANYGDLNQHHEREFNPDPYWYITNRFPHGESYHDVEVRMSAFLDHLKHNVAKTHIAIVAHKAPQFALDVLLRNKTWEQAIDEDWRKEKKWQPGWRYILPC